MAYAIDENTKAMVPVDPATDTYTKSEADNLFFKKSDTANIMLPIGSKFLRNDIKDNGGMSYGTWKYHGYFEIDVVDDSGSMSSVSLDEQFHVYIRTA